MASRALLGMSFVLLVGGAALVYASTFPLSSGWSGTTPPPGFIMGQLASGIAPWLMLVGLAIIPGLLFLRAHRWDVVARAARPASEPADADRLSPSRAPSP